MTPTRSARTAIDAFFSMTVADRYLLAFCILCAVSLCTVFVVGMFVGQGLAAGISALGSLVVLIPSVVFLASRK